MKVVTLDGPGKNALSSAMMDFVLESVEAAGGAPLLLTGAGDAFSAGLDLKEVAALDAAGMERLLGRLETMVEALYTYPGPTVAAVNGHAIAGGCVLALCCDWRVGARDPRIKVGLNEVALGLRFPPRTLRMVRARIPPRHLREVILGAALVPPEEAVRIGLLDEVAGDCLLRAREVLEALARHPREAYAAAKADLFGAVIEVGPEETRRFLEEVLPVWTSEALKSRIRAALAH